MGSSPLLAKNVKSQKAKSGFDPIFALPMLFSATGALLASAMVFCYAPLFNAALDEVLPLDPKPLQEAMR